MRPVDEVIDELRSLGRHLIFMDDNLTANREYARELFARMIPLRKRWVSQCSASIGDDGELMDLAARSGCRGLFLRLESLSQDGLAGWSKRFNRVSDYVRIVRRLHDRGIGVIAGIVFGHDWDTPAVFSRTLQFLVESKIDALQATILTPFPGTPLFREMETQGRMIDRDWAHYDFANVVFEPKQMSRETLRVGHRWVLNKFYSCSTIARRLLRAYIIFHPPPFSARVCRSILDTEPACAPAGFFERLPHYSPPVECQPRLPASSHRLKCRCGAEHGFVPALRALGGAADQSFERPLLALMHQRFW